MWQVCSHCAYGLGIISSDTHISTHTHTKKERGHSQRCQQVWLLVIDHVLICLQCVFWGLCGGGSCERRKYCTKKEEKLTLYSFHYTVCFMEITHCTEVQFKDR